MDFKEAELYIIEQLKTKLPSSLYYHSYNHVVDVLKAGTTYAEMEGKNAHEILLLKTAILFHDSGFMVQNTNHEAIGCEIARKDLPQFNYTSEDIESICGMIMATKIPQSPKNNLEEIICDADLDYLGRDDFWEIGNNLFKELEVYGILSDPKEWNKLQLKFLKSHQYFTQSAIKLRKEKKDQHTKIIEDIVNKY